MASTNAQIRAALQLRYTQFSGYTNEQVEAYLDDARLTVPLCAIPVDRQDLALMYKTLSLLSSASTSAAEGTVKKEKSGDVEIEYVTNGAGQVMGNQYELMYQNLVRPFSRNSPFVLGFRR